ncbi:SWIM zinc finger family protein [Nonomuraea sp. NPDC050556]|uniref:SWIM zinc finger family protein n=1 Tax=Nonomuraea sp. NPDC050556 TaxID=3364369 RepID=UPI0037BB869F
MTAARGFPAFAKQRAGARFATSWWGRSWIQALEDTSREQNLLRKGRAFAKAGQLGPITVSPGRITAVAEAEFHVVVQVEQLTDAEWGRFLEQVAAKAGHIAALLDGDMPHDLVEAAQDAAVPLLPAIGDLDSECECPDWGLPCKHAAALCYQTSWLLDADPFVLLLMRGRGREEVLEALRSAPVPAAGTPAAEAFALGVPPLPEPPPVEVPFTAPELEPGEGVDVAALGVLAFDAALRARELLLTGRLAVLPEWQDRVRMAAVHDLDIGAEAAVQAWRYGGADGLEVHETPWTPPKQDLARARAAWQQEGLPQVEAWRNRWTAGGVQLRLSKGGRWYPFAERDGGWWPAGPPERDPVAAAGDAIMG